MISLHGLQLVTECIELVKVDSTNRYALDCGRPGLLVIAREQTAGRGRKQRTWFSPPGDNIYLTVTVDMVDPRLTIVAGVAVQAALAGLAANREVRIKWPNDILIEGKKVCGILCEARGGIMAVGIGVNVNQTAWPDEIRDTAIALAVAAEMPLARDAVLTPLLDQLDRWFALYRSQGFEPIRAAFLDHGLLRGIRARLEDGTCCQLMDLTRDGHLEVDIAGEMHCIVSGDVLPEPERT